MRLVKCVITFFMSVLLISFIKHLLFVFLNRICSVTKFDTVTVYICYPVFISIVLFACSKICLKYGSWIKCLCRAMLTEQT